MSERPTLGQDPTRLKVIDLGTMVAGPFAATLLGDFGADVIKIERPDGDGDRMRNPDYWPVEGRNKRSVTLDLRTEEGKAILLKLVAWADVLVENFKPGTMAKWGMGYDTLSALNPRLVYVSVSGFGQTGPNSPRPGYDHVGAAFGGLWYVTGFPDRPPCLPGLPVADYFTGTFAAMGALEAIRRRDCPGGTGKGEWVELGLYEPMIRIAGANFIRHSRRGHVSERVGSMPLDDQPPAGLPHGVSYETRDGHWISMFPVTNQQWDLLARIIPEAGPPLCPIEAIKRNPRVSDGVIRRWIRERDYATVMATFIEGDLPVSPIYNTADIVGDPHVQARGNIVATQDFEGNDIRMQGVVPRLVREPGAVRWAGEALGASNQAVYEELLGLSAEELQSLSERKVI
ncbi:MAG TPA: CoA transferase [Ramlibacter sp.]|nr:CoA transferase [Ramlibacter sp.]